MNTNIQTYLDIQSKVTRINNLTSAEWDLEYAFDKFVPKMWEDGYDVEDVIEYMTVQLHKYIDKAELDGKLITTNTK
tara:strand:- start:1174 stop:1404 length:231 start_codon:yes stop_codon:yes gene_type:complete